MAPRAYFTNIEDLARFCAELTRQHVVFTVAETRTAGSYEVTIEEAHAL